MNISISPSNLDCVLTGGKFVHTVFVTFTGAPPLSGSWSAQIVKTGADFDVTVTPGAVNWNTVPGIQLSTALVITVIATGSYPFGTFQVTITDSQTGVGVFNGNVVGKAGSYIPTPPSVVVPSFIKTFDLGGVVNGVVGLHDILPSPPVFQLTNDPNVGVVDEDVIQVAVSHFTSELVDSNILIQTQNIHPDYRVLWSTALRALSNELVFLVKLPPLPAGYIGENHILATLAGSTQPVLLQTSIFNAPGLTVTDFDTLINSYAKPALVTNSVLLPNPLLSAIKGSVLNQKSQLGVDNNWLMIRLISTAPFTLVLLTIAENTSEPWIPQYSHYITKVDQLVPEINVSLTMQAVYAIRARIFDYCFASADSMNVQINGEIVQMLDSFVASYLAPIKGAKQATSHYTSLLGLTKVGGISFTVTSDSDRATIRGFHGNSSVNKVGGFIELDIKAPDVIVSNSYVLEYSYDNIIWTAIPPVVNGAAFFIIITNRLAPYYRVVNNLLTSPVFSALTVQDQLGPWDNYAAKAKMRFPLPNGWLNAAIPAQIYIDSPTPAILNLADYWVGANVLVSNISLQRQPFSYQFPIPSLTQIFALVRFNKPNKQTIVGDMLLNGVPDLGPWEVPGVLYPSTQVTIVAPAQVNEDEKFDLLGVFVFPPGRTLASLFWRQVSGPTLIIVSGGLTSNPITVMAPNVNAPVDCQVSLTVIDDLGIAVTQLAVIRICQPYYSEAPCAPSSLYVDEVVPPASC